jgi:hypothetical protein
MLASNSSKETVKGMKHVASTKPRIHHILGEEKKIWLNTPKMS